ncbi:RDD family protein [Wenyingzhuangia sp. IMCC45574]
MAEIQITTTQNVTLDFKSAELNYRLLAWFIDVLIKSAYLGLAGYVLFNFFNFQRFIDSWDPWSLMSLYFIICIPVIFYTIVLETLLGGQTVGKKIVQLKVLKVDGYQTGFVDFFIRWVMRIVDVNMLSGVIAIVSISSSKKGQRLGGIASGTAVVSLRNKINIKNTILEENIAVDYQPMYPSVVKLSDNDVRIIKENFIKAKKKNDHGLLLKLKEKIVMVIGVELHEEYSVETFIATVIKDYNHITQNM